MDDNLYNIEAENALIGAVLLAGYEVLELPAVRFVKHNHFYDAKNRLIWETIRTSCENREIIDVIAIVSRIDRKSGVTSVYLQELINQCTNYTRAEQFASIVIESAKRRFAELTIKTLGSAIYNSQNGDFDDALKSSIENLTRISQGGPGTSLPWESFTLLDAYLERPPLVYAVDELFSLPSLSIVYGAPGSLKSMLLADMALCVASGNDWLEPPKTDRLQSAMPRKIVSVPVLWIDFDNGKRRTHERVESLARSRNLEPDRTSFHYVSMPSPWLFADDEKSVNALAEYAKERSAGMIIIDNLGTISGKADENSGDMINVFANLRKLAEETKSAVIVIHHKRKSTGISTRAGENLRGHSSIEGALDLALYIERDANSPAVKVLCTKARGTDVAPFGATFAFEHKENSKELAWARFFGVRVDDDRRPARAKKAIICAIEEARNPLNKTALAKVAKQYEDDIGVNYFRDVIDAMVSTGVIIEHDAGRNNAKVYSLAD